MESHLNESEVALDGPVDPGLTSRTDTHRRKPRKHLKILYRKHLNRGGGSKPDTPPLLHG